MGLDKIMTIIARIYARENIIAFVLITLVYLREKL